ncbi:4-hydroxythreonine-4-phosphate dehydrogenase PdxA [Hyphobacterium sp. HN65]|uniref:4-hydroxythreonine-4-phosphate dehydrogenase n=1 Tax=Hyphobacterium lacteum TaxID=3116575 RepID=A0ABU7LME0_9PROT|nr:4-hydroxythreonine-4-phosphate dehydrogenase PdxA [Hyphobacterium sp. HN65]MEE2524776.1 4-hydroxythreonine-4-phosphate dehydrogenase PdxA [Hyphobacterium sp. HN65]
MTAPLAVTMGDPAGVGPEITLAAWQALRNQNQPFLVIGDPALYGDGAQAVGTPAEAFAVFDEKLPVLPVLLASACRPGTPDGANAAAILSSIEQAVDLTASGLTSGIVTNPIAKSVLYEAGFRHPGHTEYLAMLTQNLPVAGDRGPVMMLAGDKLRVSLVSIHEPLRTAIDGLSEAKILHTARVTAQALARDFGIAAPRLTVAGLNPHAGENGALGQEEIEIIAPAIQRLQAEGLNVSGPVSPDALFHEEARAGYDAAICLYHDQGLIPFKALDFWGGVNVTLGLPVIRTSPDHGTGFAIAGQGRARADSLIAAIRMASGMAERRSQ